MANVATLSFESAGKCSRLRFAKYRVPLFWLACFTREDVCSTSGEEGEIGLATTPARALALIETRKEALQSVLANLDDFLPDWLAFLRGLGEGRLLVDPTEVLMMTEADDLAGPVNAALGFFDAPTEQGAVALIDLSSLSEHIDAKTHRIATPPRKLARDAAPEFAQMLGDTLLPEDPAVTALTGFAG